MLRYMCLCIIYGHWRPAVAVKELFTAKASCQFGPKLAIFLILWMRMYISIYYIDDTEILDTCCTLFPFDEHVVQVLIAIWGWSDMSHPSS